MKKIHWISITLLTLAAGCNATKEQNESFLQVVNGLNEAGVKYRVTGNMPLIVEGGLKEGFYFGNTGHLEIDVTNKE